MGNAARTILTLDQRDPKRIFEGTALMRRMQRYGLLTEDQDKLDYVLALTPTEFLERHLRVGKQIVNIPSFLVRVESQKHIDFTLTSPFGGGRPGRVKRRNLASKSGGDGDGEEDDE